MQRIKIHSLGLTVMQINIAFFGAAAGLADILPVGSLITGSFKPGIINKCFGQINLMTIFFLPVAA